MADSKQPGNETAQEFLASMEQKLLGGMMGLGIAMGMQTGLFEVMISLGEEPKTSQEIADVANLKERYGEYAQHIAIFSLVYVSAKILTGIIY